MLTITTNKETVQGIVSGRIREHALPITDFWTKRIVNLLGFGELDEETILKRLRDNAPGMKDAEREVTFTAGGAASAKVTATVSIGVLDQVKVSGGTEGVDHYILNIREVIEVKGITNGQIEEDDIEVIGTDGTPVGLRNAPALRKIVKVTGFCRYCNQARIIDAPEGSGPEDLNDLATEDCDCDEAIRQRERRQRMEAAGLWAKNTFSKEDGQLQVALCAIRATFDGQVSFVTMKIGKHTHKIDTDKDGMIRIRTTYRDSNEETF